MKTITIETFSIDELSDVTTYKPNPCGKGQIPVKSPRDVARDWYRQEMDENSDEYEFDGILSDAETVGGSMGIDAPSESFRYDVSFAQGSGASFIGSYAYKSGGYKEVVANYPEDIALQIIAKGLQEVQSRAGYRLRADVEEDRMFGNYSHEHSVRIRVYMGDSDDELYKDERAEDVKRCLRKFMQWVHHSMEVQALSSREDENVDEEIRYRDYSFTAAGKKVEEEDDDCE